MKKIMFIIMFVSSYVAFGSVEHIKNWKSNQLITESVVVDYIYEQAFEEFIGDDGVACEPTLVYAELQEFISDKEFIVKTKLTTSSMDHACSYFYFDDGKYDFTFKFNENSKRFNVLMTKVEL